MRWTAAWIVTCLAVASSSACASMQLSKERRDRLQRELDAYRYQQPPPEVWQQVRLLLAGRGYPLAGTDAEAVGQKSGGLAMLLSPAKETYPYRPDSGLAQKLGIAGEKPVPRDDGSVSLDTGWKNTGERFHVDGLVSDGGFRVVFTRVVQDITDHHDQATRDVAMELALARRLDPHAADRMEKAADAPR